MKYQDEFPIAIGPTQSSYRPGEEQAQHMEWFIGPELNRKLEVMMEWFIGPELNRKLEVMAAKMEVIDKIRNLLIELTMEVKGKL